MKEAPRAPVAYAVPEPVTTYAAPAPVYTVTEPTAQYSAAPSAYMTEVPTTYSLTPPEPPMGYTTSALPTAYAAAERPMTPLGSASPAAGYGMMQSYAATQR